MASAPDLLKYITYVLDVDGSSKIKQGQILPNVDLALVSDPKFLVNVV